MVTNDWTNVLSHTFIPRIQMDKTYLALLVGVLGTTISPYLFF
jgi:Mn2+/Fe2+ NRAMP family transporter